MSNSPPSSFAQWKEQEKKSQATTNASSQLTQRIIPRSDMGVGKLMEKKVQKHSFIHSEAGAARALHEMQQTIQMQEKSENANDFCYSIWSQKVCLVMYLGISLIIIMAFLLRRGAWKGKMSDVVNLISMKITNEKDDEL